MSISAALALPGCGPDGSGTPALAAVSPAAPASASASAAEGEAPESEAPAIPPPKHPVVDLNGVTTLPAPIAEGVPRIAVLEFQTPVLAAPHPKAKTLGYLRAGAVVAAAEAAAGTEGCPGGWRQIEPVGFVCLGKDATADLEHPVVRAASRGPMVEHRLPYMYGTVTRGGPIYKRLPTAKELRKHEPSLKWHLRKWRQDEVSGASYGLDVWLRYADKPAPPALEALESKVTDDDLPWFLQNGGEVPNLAGFVSKKDDGPKIGEVSRRTGRSFIYSFLYEGRRYNVTPELAVIPADRFRPIRGSSFHGWRVGEEIQFPFALVRRLGARKWQWQAGKMVDGGALEWRSAVELTGKQRFYDKVLHYETKEGFWVDDRHAGRVDPAKRWPKWAQQGAKWIDVNLTKQVLVAYEGQKAVYTTLISSGEAGLADASNSTATKTGIFRIHAKWVTVTMSSNEVGEEFELRDVPYVQYFEGGYAIHGAYWHDMFGRPKSHGCINLSPEDARRLFFWTDPPVPARWHGAEVALTGTVVFVHP